MWTLRLGRFTLCRSLPVHTTSTTIFHLLLILLIRHKCSTVNQLVSVHSFTTFISPQQIAAVVVILLIVLALFNLLLAPNSFETMNHGVASPLFTSLSLISSQVVLCYLLVTAVPERNWTVSLPFLIAYLVFAITFHLSATTSPSWLSRVGSFSDDKREKLLSWHNESFYSLVTCFAYCWHDDVGSAVPLTHYSSSYAWCKVHDNGDVIGWDEKLQPAVCCYSSVHDWW